MTLSVADPAWPCRWCGYEAPVGTIRDEHLERCPSRPRERYVPDPDDGALLTYAEAAAVADVAPATVRSWVNRGALPVVEVDGRKLVPERQLLDCERAKRRSGRRRVG